MSRLPHAGRIFISLWIILCFYGDPLLEINTVRYLFLARAVVEDGAFEVDRFAHASKGDLSVVNGNYYPTAPPGIGLMLTPVALLARVTQDFSPFRPNLWLQILSIVLFNAPAAALACILLGEILIAFGALPKRAVLLALTSIFGTHLFFFTSKLSDYPMVTLMELILIRGCIHALEAPLKRRLLLIGGALGIIATVNHVPMILMILLLLFIFPTRPFTEFARRWSLILAGASPCILARSLYMKSCFGSALADPLSFSAAKISIMDVAKEQPYLPRVLAEAPQAFYDITIGPVGLFTFAPVFLLLFVPLFFRSADGIGSADSKNMPVVDNRSRWIKGLIVIAIINALAHFALVGQIWRGGASWGPRYMLYSSTLLFIPMALFAERLRMKTLAILCGVSIFINWVGVQYGYNLSILDEVGLFFIGGPTTPAFRLMWLHWMITPTPERVALVMEETPRIGHYYAFTHPTPIAGCALVVLILLFLWIPVIKKSRLARSS